MTFTIFSNNCWSNKVYEHLKVQYQTPLINIFLHPQCYLELLKYWKWYVKQPLHFIDKSRHENINQLREERKTSYPIAVLGGNVELQCLHFETTVEVETKWNRRLQRIVQDDSRWFFKFSDELGCTQEQMEEFDDLPYANKVCYTSRPMPHLKSAVHIPGGKEVSFEDQTNNSYFDAIRWVTQ